MKKKDCIFCKIANGEIPSKTIYEDDDFRAILDISPATKGHALIISKEHFTNIYELDEGLALKAMKVTKKIASQIKAKLECEGLNIVQNNGELAGQTVFHFHIHLIPRYRNDNQKIGWNAMSLSSEELENIMKKILE